MSAIVRASLQTLSCARGGKAKLCHCVFEHLLAMRIYFTMLFDLLVAHTGIGHYPAVTESLHLNFARSEHLLFQFR